MNISCAFCQVPIERSEYEVNRAVKLGRSFYCTLSCSAKHGAQQRNQKLWNIDEYNANPNKCKCCDADLPYEKKYNKFCNQSCAAKFNNPFKKVIQERKNTAKPKVTKNCVSCGTVMENVRSDKKYCCHTCSSNHRRKIKFDQIESGDGTLYVRNYRNYLIHIRGNKCEDCGWDKINSVTGNCPIELEHIDGNSENNSIDNLKLLCPNCHSLTSTYKNLNKGKGRHSRRKRYAEGKSY
jgi:hypothetical protein